MVILVRTKCSKKCWLLNQKMRMLKTIMVFLMQIEDVLESYVEQINSLLYSIFSLLNIPVFV